MRCLDHGVRRRVEARSAPTPLLVKTTWNPRDARAWNPTGDAQSRPEGTASLVSVCSTNTPLSIGVCMEFMQTSLEIVYMLTIRDSCEYLVLSMGTLRVPIPLSHKDRVNT
jgi:hypothetical protein